MERQRQAQWGRRREGGQPPEGRGARVDDEVDEAGGVVRGAGFEAQRISTGEYALAFDAAFVAPPVVVAVAQSCTCGAA